MVTQPPSVCGKLLTHWLGANYHLDLCDSCYVSTQETIANLRFRIKSAEEQLVNAHRVCVTCTGSNLADPIHCISLDCLWFYARRKAEAGTEIILLIEELIEELEVNVDRDPDIVEVLVTHELDYDSMYETDSAADDQMIDLT